jgi:hypothetical protein
LAAARKLISLYSLKAFIHGFAAAPYKRGCAAALKPLLVTESGDRRDRGDEPKNLSLNVDPPFLCLAGRVLRRIQAGWSGCSIFYGTLSICFGFGKTPRS